ncbi:MAG: FHA domain-containing protein [Candidatus Competibacteraceae bacterium]|nr:FHA domain-containing protein [Candidatus Competibacteraceae bacterium]
MSEQRAVEATKVHRALAQYRLRGVSGTTFGKVFPLRATTTLGRQGDCQVVVEDDGVSRHHARVEVEGDRVRVVDLNSSNGTFVNGQRVLKGELKPGDELALDNVRFLLELSGGAESHAPAPRPTPAAAPVRRQPPVEEDEGLGIWLWVGIGGAAVIIIATAIALLL